MLMESRPEFAEHEFKQGDFLGEVTRHILWSGPSGGDHNDWPNLEDKREMKPLGLKSNIGAAERSAILGAIQHWNLTNRSGA